MPNTVSRKYSEFYTRHGYLPEVFNPYNLTDLGERDSYSSYSINPMRVSYNKCNGADCGE